MTYLLTNRRQVGKPPMRTGFIVAIALAIVMVFGTSARSQPVPGQYPSPFEPLPSQRSFAEIDPVYRDELTQLARMLGALHALELLCFGEHSQIWRLNMQQLLEIESPASANLADRLINAFNNNYQKTYEEHAFCSAEAFVERRRLARRAGVSANRLRDFHVE